MSEVVYLNQGHSFWDQTLLKDLLEEVHTERQIVVVPGSINDVDEVSMELAQYPKVLVMITSDEESKFPIDELFHPDMIIYSNYYNPKFKNVNHWLPIGYPKHINLPVVDKDSWFFAGQVTHQSRRECVEALKSLGNGVLIETEGFAQGVEPDEYYALMNRAKVVPCPRGAVNDDSFRLCEALELGCVPIPENPEYWRNLFGGEPPFPVVSSWEQLPGYITDAIRAYPLINNKVQAWWLRYKRDLIWNLSQS